MAVPVFAGEGRLCSFFAAHMVLLRRKLRSPLLLGFQNLLGHNFPSEAGIPDLPALDHSGHGVYCMSSMQMYWCYFAFFREFSMHDFASRIRKQGCATILAILQQKAVFQQSCFGHAAFP